MPGDVEPGIIDPHRPAAARWRWHEPLAQARDAAYPVRQRLAHPARREMRAGLEHQNRSYLQRHRADVGGELHHVDRTRALDQIIARTLLEPHDPHHLLRVTAAARGRRRWPERLPSRSGGPDGAVLPGWLRLHL